MDIKVAADRTRSALIHFVPARAEDGRGGAHARWMLEEIMDGNVVGDKAHRWLGYAQGVCVSEEWAKLEKMKEANR